MKKLYIPLLISLLSTTSCSSNEELRGNWKQLVCPDNHIQAFLGYDNDNHPMFTTVHPFNTSMYLKYFFNEKNEDNVTLEQNVKEMYVNEVERLHTIFDRHYNYLDDNNELITNIKTINESYGKNTPIKCSNELYSLLKTGIECYDLTNGYFNIFTGTITDYWDDVFLQAYDLEPLENIDPYFNETQRIKLAHLVEGIPNTKEDINNQLTFNDETKEVTFNAIKDGLDEENRPQISVGGIAKGYANDLVKDKLVSNNYLDGILMSGGSSITSLSNPIYSKESNGQSISIVNPATSSFFDMKAAFSMNIKDEFCFSTSGNYTTDKSYTFIDNDGKTIYRHHIINPYTGYPESYHRSVSILSYNLSSALADALTTAFMTISLEDGIALRNKILEINPDNTLELFILDQEGKGDNAIITVHATSNINNTLKANDNVEIKYEE